MPSFDLLSLQREFRAITCVLNGMGAGCLLNLSFSSRNARQMVERHARAFEVFLDLFYPYKAYIRSVALGNFSIEIREERTVEPDRWTLDGYRTINGSELKCYKGPNTQLWVSDHPEIQIFDLVDYLKQVFSCRLGRLDITLTPMLNSLDTFFRKDFYRKAVNLSVARGSVSPQEMKHFFVFFSRSKASFHCNPGQNFIYNAPITFQSVEFLRASWFSLNHLLHLNCRKVKIIKSTLTASDLNKFVKKWLESKNKKLEYLQVVHETNKAYKMPEITQGITTIPGSRKKADATNFRLVSDAFLDGPLLVFARQLAAIGGPRVLEVPFETGLDVRRATDNSLATILTFNHLGNKIFLFLVWNHPNPFAL